MQLSKSVLYFKSTLVWIVCVCVHARAYMHAPMRTFLSRKKQEYLFDTNFDVRFTGGRILSFSQKIHE